MNDIGVIHLTNGGFTVVDADMFDQLDRHNWQMDKNGYVVRGSRIGKNTTPISMHRVVNQTPSGNKTDHKNGVKFDNRRDNLRTASNQQNGANRQIKPHSSKFKGVTWDKSRRKWKATIKVNYKLINLGRFEREEDAGMAYNKKAVEHFGQFACINPIQSGVSCRT